MAAKDGLAIRQARDRQTPGVRRLSLLAPMNHQDQARAGLDARDQCAHAEAGMDAATTAACVGVVSAAHRSSAISVSMNSSSDSVRPRATTSARTKRAWNAST